MTNKQGVLVGCALFGAGLALGVVLFGAGPAPEPDPSSTNVTRHHERIAAPGLAGDIRPAPGLEGRPELESLSRDPLADAIASIEATEAETVEGTISGSVKTPDGQPVAGVEVMAVPPYPRGPHAPHRVTEDSMARMAAHTIAAQKFMLRHTRIATTDDAGRYVLSDLVQGNHRVSASHPKWSMKLATGRSIPTAQAGETVDFIARVRTGLRLQVSLPDGSPPDQAQVFLKGPGYLASHTWRPDAPVIEAPTGSYDLNVTSGAEGVYASTMEQVVAPKDGVSELIQVALRERTRVVVDVTFAGDKVRPVDVRYTRVPPGTAADPDMLASRLRQYGSPEPNRARRVTNARHVFYIDADELGEVLVAASEKDKRLASASSVLVHPETRLALVVPGPRLDGRILARIEGPGESMPDSPTFLVYVRQGKGISGGSTAARDEGNGLYSFPEPSVATTSESETQIMICASVKGWGYAVGSAAWGRNEPIVLKFARPLNVRVRVRGIAGTIFANAARLSLRVMRDGVTPSLADTAIPNLGPKGEAVLHGIQPGRYEAWVAQTGASSGAWLHVEPVEIGEGTTRLDLTLPKLAVVTVHAPPGASTYVTRVTDREAPAGSAQRRPWFANQTTSQEGIAKFVGVPAGRYQVSSGSAIKEVDVNDDMDVRLQD